MCGTNFTCPDGRMHSDIDARQTALTDQLNAVWWVVGIAGALGIAGLVIGLVELLTAPSDEGIDASAHARLRLRPRIDGFAVLAPPGEKKLSTPFGNARTRSGRNPSSINSSRVASDGVIVRLRR